MNHYCGYIWCEIHYSYYLSINIWYTGILIFLLLILISFLGYILPWGQMSYWGGTVITNIIALINLILLLWICGEYTIESCTLKRFYNYHINLSITLNLLLIFHIYYLHIFGSNNMFNRIN